MYQVWIWKVLSARFVLFGTFDAVDAADTIAGFAGSGDGLAYVEEVI